MGQRRVPVWTEELFVLASSALIVLGLGSVLVGKGWMISCVL
jgi:hypothetical protein